MEFKQQSELLVVVVLMFAFYPLFLTPTEAATSTVFDKDVTNILFYGDYMFVAGNGVLYQIEKNSLNITRTVSTCKDSPPAECNNLNKVLVITPNGLLVLCGTGNDGQCEIRHADNLTYVTQRPLKTEMKVSNDTREAVALVTGNGAITLGATFGGGFEMEPNSQGHSFKYPLSTWYQDDNYGFSKNKSILLAINSDGNSYLIFYKAAFQSDGKSYFLTNQKQYKNDPKNVTKLVRFCQNDKDYDTYVDAVLNCTKEGKNYNLLQDAIITELTDKSGKLFVGTFTTADEPSAVTGDSAICVASLSLLNNGIDENRDNAINCPGSNLTNGQWYLPKGLENCFNISVTSCNSIPFVKYIIGQTPIKLEPVFSLTKDKGFITKVSAMIASDNRSLVIIAGTSRGGVTKLKLDVTGSTFSPTARMYENITVRQNSPIRAINIQDPDVYILTKRRVDKLMIVNCSRFKTCEETRSGNDPFCGWCVLQSKSTRKSNCSNNEPWIPPGEPCVQVNLNLERIPADGSEQEIHMHVSYLRLADLGASLSCKLKNKVDTFKAEATDDNVACNIKVPEKHTSTVIELRAGDTVLAESAILFYKCNEFNKCGECTKARGEGQSPGCTWCDNSLSCMDVGACSSVNECPQLEGNRDTIYVPNGVPHNISLKARNLPPSNSNFKYTCKVCGQEFDASASSTNVTCSLKIDSPEIQAKRFCSVKVLYKGNSAKRYLDEDSTSLVTVYRCENLAQDCTHCRALNGSRYTCNWCGSTCKYNPNKKCDDTCPPPSITKIYPSDGTPKGGTRVSMVGLNLFNGTRDVQFGNKTGDNCTFVFNHTDGNGDFNKSEPYKIICTVPHIVRTGDNSTDVIVLIKIDNQSSTHQPKFSYRVPVLRNIYPSIGPMAGGTRVTITGENLGIGNKKVEIRFNTALSLNECKVNQGSPSFVVCRTPPFKQNATKISISIDAFRMEYTYNLSFYFVSNPEIEDVHPNRCTKSGGTSLTVTGKNLNHAGNGKTTVKYDGQENVEECVTIGRTEVICKCPVAPASVQSDLETRTDPSTSKRRRKREAEDSFEDGSISVQVIVELDGVDQTFSLSYFVDPSFDLFDNVRIFESDEKSLVITGKNLNLVANEKDVNVKIGIDTCSVVKLTRTELTCVTSRTDEDGTVDQEVNVEIGNYRQRVGYVRYEHTLEMYIYIIAGASGALLAIIIIVAVIAVTKLRRQRSKAKQLQDKLNNLETEMVNVAREEFLDMNVTMSGVNQNLVEQGFPYHGYLEFASHIIFASGYIHIEPVVSRAQISEKAKSGMETFEHLLCNKFFLLSIISTMEKQKKFFVREKANFAGHLCQVMMGRMDYLNEIIGLLIQNQVHDAVKKKHQKSLFRRTESITENLLNDWLFLCLYHHIKADTGSPLYLLYMVMQKTMEAGPIDAVTGDAKYTLCEEKLLKKWRTTNTDNRDEISFEAKTLNLRVIVDNGTQIYDCKALDCDTITQVKGKCLSQIYVNYPASQMAVGATDLRFNWHAGSCGLLPLSDIDVTSKREGSWVRLNTLAHYNVPDDANMALVDPKCVDLSQEDYENLGAVMMAQRVSGEADNLDLIQDTNDDDTPEQHWHLIKPDTSVEKQEKSAIDDLYLNRLISTKHSVAKYMTDLFDVILSEPRCPAPVKRIFDLFDTLETKFRVDSDTVLKWKSHSYLIRVWGSLMLDPSRLFDINIPPYVESSLGVVAQVFIDACSQASTEVTKDISPQKLSFMSVIKDYKEKVAPFVNDVKATEQSQDDLRRYFDVVNKLQKQQNFQKTSSLHKIYDQLKPYMDTIIDELSQNKEASSLQLNQKLSQVIQLMEDDV